MRGAVYIGLFFPFALTAQGVSTSVGADLDTAVIRIGEQVHLTLQVSGQANALKSVEWPTIADTLSKHVEVVADGPIDTLQSADAIDRLVRKLTLTSFDSGFWAVPPFRFVVDGTTLETKPLLIEVRTVELDSAGTLRDITNIHTLPFSAWYWVRAHALWVGGGVAALALISALIYFMLRKREPRAVKAPVVAAIPLQQRVLLALEALEKERLWQQGEHKGYHSRITNLLRGYIEERYQVPAMESTTDELLRELRVSPLNSDQRGQLENMLRLADMVKFAKTLPSPQENEQMMAGSVRFVRSTASIPTALNNG